MMLAITTRILKQIESNSYHCLLINSLDTRSETTPVATTTTIAHTQTPLTSTLVPVIDGDGEGHKNGVDEHGEGENEGKGVSEVLETSPRSHQLQLKHTDDKEKERELSRAEKEKSLGRSFMKGSRNDNEVGRTLDKQSHPITQQTPPLQTSPKQILPTGQRQTPPQTHQKQSQALQKQPSIHDPDFGSDPTPDPVEEPEKEPMSTTTMTTTITKGSDFGGNRNRFLSTVVTSNIDPHDGSPASTSAAALSTIHPRQ
ncbi:hypothetical protein M1146_03415, partial [Patescibacteria group bacterium]|nr:hypothetical protein [Patescibacteria group bacterium]